jgi:hypothetical protein
MTLTNLPPLPDGLKKLVCRYTQLTSLPPLPYSLEYLYCDNTPLILQRHKDEGIQAYEARWAEWRFEIASKERAKERCLAIKEDLMVAAWHPKRVEQFVQQDRWDLLD